MIFLYNLAWELNYKKNLEITGFTIYIYIVNKLRHQYLKMMTKFSSILVFISLIHSLSIHTFIHFLISITSLNIHSFSSLFILIFHSFNNSHSFIDSFIRCHSLINLNNIVKHSAVSILRSADSKKECTFEFAWILSHTIKYLGNSFTIRPISFINQGKKIKVQKRALYKTEGKIKITIIIVTILKVR